MKLFWIYFDNFNVFFNPLIFCVIISDISCNKVQIKLSIINDAASCAIKYNMNVLL